MKNSISILFIVLGLLALVVGVSCGLVASFQYIVPSFLKESFPFQLMRPLHTSMVISWIVLTATGSIYFFISKKEGHQLFSPRLMRLHLLLFVAIAIGMFISFFTDGLRGREYLSFAPYLTIPILFGWLLFAINYYKTLLPKVKNWPVYYWMWGTGLIFMIYHLSEAHFWMIPSLRAHVVKDMAVMWKSYGSFVGSWNMLVYGIAIYLMTKISGNSEGARGKKVFFFYFLGLTNLMFGWAHHTYVLPTQPWIRYVAYAVSMTEWIVLANIIYTWKKSLNQEVKTAYSASSKFLFATDFWVFANIVLALLMSIPAIHIYTHGTHITVAHSMGTTIGINTTILMAAVFFVIKELNFRKMNLKYFSKVYYLFNGALLLFFTTLMYAGAVKSAWLKSGAETTFSAMQESLSVVYILFFACGLALAISLYLLVAMALKPLFGALKNRNSHLAPNRH